MEKEQRRISRVERNGKKSRRLSRNKDYHIVYSNTDCIFKDSERNKRKKNQGISRRITRNRKTILTSKDSKLEILAIILIIIGIVIIGASFTQMALMDA